MLLRGRDAGGGLPRPARPLRFVYEVSGTVGEVGPPEVVESMPASVTVRYVVRWKQASLLRSRGPAPYHRTASWPSRSPSCLASISAPPTRASLTSGTRLPGSFPATRAR